MRISEILNSKKQYTFSSEKFVTLGTAIKAVSEALEVESEIARVYVSQEQVRKIKRSGEWMVSVESITNIKL